VKRCRPLSRGAERMGIQEGGRRSRSRIRIRRGERREKGRKRERCQNDRWNKVVRGREGRKEGGRDDSACECVCVEAENANEELHAQMRIGRG